MSTTIADKLNTLLDTKLAIKNSLIDKNIEVDNEPFKEYADLIDMIGDKSMEIKNLIGEVGSSDSYIEEGIHEEIALIKPLGIYQYDIESTELVDGEFTINGKDNIGRWNLLIPSIEFVDIFIKSQISSLTLEEEDKLKYEVQTITATLNFGYIDKGSDKTMTVSHLGAKKGDIIQIEPPTFVSATTLVEVYVSDYDTISINIKNTNTYSSVTIPNYEYKIALLKLEMI